MSVADAVVSKRERLFEVMSATADRSMGVPDVAIKQFIVGFINVLEASARGDHSARELYLTSVIPALRQGPLPLEAVIEAMLRVTAATACVLGPEHV
jgi:hypothetical protein